MSGNQYCWSVWTYDANIEYLFIFCSNLRTSSNHRKFAVDSMTIFNLRSIVSLFAHSFEFVYLSECIQRRLQRCFFSFKLEFLSKIAFRSSRNQCHYISRFISKQSTQASLQIHHTIYINKLILWQHQKQNHK